VPEPELDNLELTIMENGDFNPQSGIPSVIGWRDVKLHVQVYEAPVEANKVSVRLYNNMGLDDIIGYTYGTTPVMGRGTNASEPLRWGVGSNLEYVDAGIPIGHYSDYFYAFPGSNICVNTGYTMRTYTVPAGGGTITVS
jgi:hypothetical protein